MSPRSVGVAILVIVLGVLMAVGMFGANVPSRTLTDDDYRSIAISQPQVFHPSGPTSGQQVQAGNVTREGNTVTVEVVSDGQRFKVVIDARSNQVTQIVKQ
jgi:hypothetical protein